MRTQGQQRSDAGRQSTDDAVLISIGFEGQGEETEFST